MITAFGDKLRALLAERGWSQNDLARRSGYDRGHVSKIINGNRPSRNMAEVFDALLGAGGELVALVPAPVPRAAPAPRRPSPVARQVADLSGEIRELRAEVSTLIQAIAFALSTGGDAGGAAELCKRRACSRE